MYRKATTVLLTVVLVSLMLFVMMPRPASAKFIIAAWSEPDEYGQCIEAFDILENSSSTWEEIPGCPFMIDTDPNIFNWTAGVAIKLTCYTWFNSTLTGATTGTLGRNYQRHNVTVTDNLGYTVFSKQNFTWYSTDTGIDPPMWFYEYYIVLNFLPLAGEYYTVTVIYEVFW